MPMAIEMHTFDNWKLHTLGRERESPAPPRRRVETWHLLWFAMLVGLLAAATSGYGYGRGASASHLAEILRTMDAAFLANDFWLNAQDGFGPRFYYRLAAAAVAAVIPLWLVYAAAYVLAAVATSVVTALAARDLAGTALAAYVAAPLAMWTVPYEFAAWPAIYNASGGTRFTNPQLVAEPLCLLALWRGIRGCPRQAATISVPAVLLHPTVGLGAAAIALAAASAHLGRQQAGRRGESRGACGLATAAGTVAVVVVGFWIVPGVMSGALFSLDGSEVVRLVAYVGHPSHFLPSTWPTAEIARPAVFWAAGALALAGLQRRSALGESVGGGTRPLPRPR